MEEPMRFQDCKEGLEARFPGCEISDDGFVIHAVAPEGHTWDGDLHEYILEYKSAVCGSISNRGNAVKEVFGRVEFSGAPVKCDDTCECQQ